MSIRIATAAVMLVVFTTPIEARLTRIVIEKRSTAGDSETLTGRFFGELDPKDPHNTIIQDI